MQCFNARQSGKQSDLALGFACSSCLVLTDVFIVFEIPFLPVDGITQHNDYHTSSLVFLLFLPHELGFSRRNNDGAWLNHTRPQPAAAQSRLQSPGIQNMAPTVRCLDTTPGLEENASSRRCPWLSAGPSRRDDGVLHHLCSCMGCHKFLRFHPIIRWFGTRLNLILIV
jgi:hypothetical protein